jgi:hypothetical protein
VNKTKGREYLNINQLKKPETLLTIEDDVEIQTLEDESVVIKYDFHEANFDEFDSVQKK